MSTNTLANALAANAIHTAVVMAQVMAQVMAHWGFLTDKHLKMCRPLEAMASNLVAINLSSDGLQPTSFG